MSSQQKLPDIPFDRFLKYSELTGLLRTFESERPDLCKLGSIGLSRQGREIPLLTVTRFQDGMPADKPAYLIHANIHACEMSGTHAAVYTARQLLLENPEILKDVVFHIVPRLNPDGAEFVVNTSGNIRSRNEEKEEKTNNLYQKDIDGNGYILSMREKHPDGQFAKDPRDPRLMIERRFDTPGPFYRLFPEGLIHNWDGGEDIEIGGRRFDWNRNWSYDWRPEPEQPGSGDFPFSEPEMRCIGEFIHKSPNLFGVLGYHTGPAAVLRPPSSGCDNDIDEEDLYIMNELAGIAGQETGFPVIPVVKYHISYKRDLNLHGHFHNFGYHHLGLFVFEFELGIIHNSAGISTEEQLGAKNNQESEAQMRKLMQWWDRKEDREPLFADWKSFRHPQLGEVEIGGFLNQYLSNPSLGDMQRIARGTYRFTLQHAKRYPLIVIEDLKVEKIAPALLRVRARAANRGAFPTNITNKGKGLGRIKGLRAEFLPAEGAELLSMRSQFDIGHLDGIKGSFMLEWFVRCGEKRLGDILLSGGTAGTLRRSVEFC